MTYSSVIYELAESLGDKLRTLQMTCGVAESCTGGSLSATLTSIPGSSDWFDRGFVTYSNTAKNQMLNVPLKIIQAFGAVSEQTAIAMAEGVISEGHVDTSVAITGIAGPGGGTKDKPVGTVWIAWAGGHQATHSHCFHFQGNRPAIRHQAVEAAIEGLIGRCETAPQSLKQTSERYFFGVFPEIHTALKTHQQSKELLKDIDCSIIPKEKLHMTLTYLGSVGPGFVQDAMQVATSLEQDAFAIDLVKASSWKKQSICVLEPNDPPVNLKKLVAQLNAGLISVGFKPARMTFKPHVTIARNCPKHLKPHLKKSLQWQVNSFHLVRSSQKSGQTVYEKIDSWPLG